MLRLQNPVRNISREGKIAAGILGGTVVLIGTVATIAWASSGDPEPMKKALDVGPGCTTYAIASEQQLRDELRASLREAAKKGPIDPLQVAAKYIRHVAPRCPTYPAHTETPAQVKLFADVYLQLLDVMVTEDYMSGNDYPVWVTMMTTWAAGQGVSAEDL